MKIAVIGAGISGITAAYLLGKQHDVTLFERDASIGGHTNTIMVADEQGPLPVDTGFIVCNPRTYPLFYRLLDEWDVRLRDSDMSFGFYCESSRLGYVGPALREFMRKPSNLLQPRLLGMFREQRRFNKRARADLAAGAIGDITLDAYLERVGASRFFIDHYLVPLAASVWSSPDSDMRRFPALTFIQFFQNHGMLDLSDRPTWQTVVGGSHAYLDAFQTRFAGEIRTDTPVESVARGERGVTVRVTGREASRFDRVVLATHADVSLGMLADACDDERSALTAWTYHVNTAQLHTDESVMPADRRLWASWNYHRRADADPHAPVAITYSMNRLQGLRTNREYLVSLNAASLVDPEHVIYSVDYTHPGYTPQSIEAQAKLRDLNGTRHTYFCGAHIRYGFHEDGVASALDVTKHFGVEL
ncbi:MAG: NAD(P)/FAD-dependent oxidoreductase [Planctomycetota bacterium]|jgi:predicted NAD/FAD-binding protein